MPSPEPESKPWRYERFERTLVVESDPDPVDNLVSELRLSWWRDRLKEWQEMVCGTDQRPRPE